MEKNEILSTIRSLACSQGFYGRLYEWLMEETRESIAFLDKMVEQRFRSVIDLIEFVEE